MSSDRVVALTGASGYLGSCIGRTLEGLDWKVTALVRDPKAVPFRAAAYDLAQPITSPVHDALCSADVLVHAAYDLGLTRADDIWRVNVEGTRRLLDAATTAGIRRVLVLSSMSAYSGTRQLYGRAKLEIEQMTLRAGGVALRPGLVYGDRPGGMAGSLRALTRLPVIPIVRGAAQYTVREGDLTGVVAALAETEHLDPQTISVAGPVPVPLRDLLETFASEDGRRCRFAPIPWRLVYAILKTGEALHLRLPFRADSLLGLVRVAPSLVGSQAFCTPSSGTTPADQQGTT
jgi:nucleoside-diphosphate-sugar epimerase